jgi:hypothetical protein
VKACDSREKLGRSRSIKFHSSPNDQNCSINLKAVITPTHHSTNHQPMTSQHQRDNNEGSSYAAQPIKAASFLIDGEAVIARDDGLPVMLGSSP